MTIENFRMEMENDAKEILANGSVTSDVQFKNVDLDNKEITVRIRTIDYNGETYFIRHHDDYVMDVFALSPKMPRILRY